MTISAEGKKKQAINIYISEKAFKFAIGNAKRLWHKKRKA